MPRLLRKSTLAKTEETKTLITIRNRKPKKKLNPVKVKSMQGSTSSKLRSLIGKEEDLFKEELQRLYSLFCTIDESNSKSLTSPREQGGNSDTEESTTDQVEGEGLTWDSSQDINSPEKDTSDIFDLLVSSPPSVPPALSKDRSESVSVNLAEFDIVHTNSGLDLQLEPVCRTESEVELGREQSKDLSLAPSPLQATRNLAETLPAIEEENDVGGERMDGEEYKRKMKALKGAVRRAEDKISSYVADCVTADKETVQMKLKDIRVVFKVSMDMANNFIDELNEDDQTDETRITEISGLKKDLTAKLIKNEKEVNERLSEVLTAKAEMNPPENTTRKEENIKAERLKTRMGFIQERASGIKSIILKMKKAKDMTDREIRKSMVEVKDLEDKLEKIVQSKEKLEEDAVGTDMDSDDIKEMKESVMAAVDSLAAKVSNLKVEDEVRGLHSLDKSGGKDSVVYPEPFTGKEGENVFLFKRKFEQAISDAHVKEVDKVEVLMKYLKGRAKQLMGDHYEDLATAMDALVSYFNNPNEIWEKSIEKLEKKFSNVEEAWGDLGNQQRVLAIARIIEFVNEGEILAKKFPNLESEVYSRKTVRLLLRVTHNDYREEFIAFSGNDATYKEDVLNMKEFMESRKNTAIKAARYGPDDENSHSSGSSFGRSKNQSSYGSKEHDCRKSSQCKQEWGGLGCVELYKCKTQKERLNWLAERKLCFMCGCEYEITNHKCSWSAVGKSHAKCQFKDCIYAAASCRSKFHKMRKSRYLTDWLEKCNVDPAHLVQVGVRQISCFESLDKIPAKKRIKTKTSPLKEDAERVKLQNGEGHKQMDDDELVTFFTEDMKRVTKSKPDIRPIPEGEPVFIFSVFQGLKGPVMAFIDSGCNFWLAEEGIPETELKSCKLADGPIPMGVAGGQTVNASAEWASLLPLGDGGHQIVRGLTVPQVTQDMPVIAMAKIFKKIKKRCNKKEIKNLEVPKVVGGRVNMILGIRYQNIYPIPIHQFPNGLTVFKSQLMPAFPGAVACIGGPVSALDNIASALGGQSAIKYMTTLVTGIRSVYKPRLDFFPEFKNRPDLIDKDIPGVEEIFTDVNASYLYDETDPNKAENDKETEVERGGEQSKDLSPTLSPPDDRGIGEEDSACDTCGMITEKEETDPVGTAVQSEFQKFMRTQEVGLDSSYRCRRCRDCSDCKRGSGFEKISLMQEAEQELIKESIFIDYENSRAIVHLPFKANPKEFLRDNSYSAQARLQNTCKKYYKDETIRKQIIASFDKLRNRGHLKYYEDLSENQRTKLENAEVSYTIPWDISFKPSSVSTPTRSVYDASAKTSTGFSLNDLLATGVPDLVRLFELVLEWQIGPVAIVGDVSQFYPTIKLHEDSWPFQKIMLREDLNPNGKLILAVIVSVIFGVCSSGGQCEEVIRMLAEAVKQEFPEVAKFLTDRRYVDDLGKSVKDKMSARKLIRDTEHVLKMIGMEIKGWSMSGEIPAKELTEDGLTINFGGMKWFPPLDGFMLNIDKLHFAKKKRGRYEANLKRYEEDSDESLEEFTPKNLSRRMCTSVIARIYDLLGRLAPLTLRFKHDLRRLIEENPDWDAVLSPAKRLRWIENFQMIEDIRGIMYARCVIPPGALDTKARIWVLCDAADGGVMVGVYASFRLKDNKWSCANIMGKGLLAPEGWTIPKRELQALCTASDVKVVVERALGDWIDSIYVGGDSEISLAWCIYENVKLLPFHRNRVNNVRTKVDMSMLHHVQGLLNPSDTGTRPDSVRVNDIMPGSPWLSGKDWMRLPYEDAIKSGVIKTVKNIKLNNDEKKKLKEGIVFETFDDKEDNAALSLISVINIRKVAEREAYSDYIYPPLRRSWLPTVRIISIVLLAVRKFKRLLLVSKVRDGRTDVEEIKKFDVSKVRFTAFHLNIHEEDDVDGEHPSLAATFGTTAGILCKVGVSKKNVTVKLTDEDLSSGLEYLFKKATQEILHFEDKKEIEKNCAMIDDVLYCKSRILEGSTVKAVGALSECIDLETYTGIKFKVPMVSKDSPLAVSLAMHHHYHVSKHRGYETTYRLSLQNVRIMQGKRLFQQVSNDCVYCKKLRIKYVKQLMGPLADSQLSISPIFYFTYLDMWGPISLFAPGFEKVTRARQLKYEAHVLVMGCAATGAVNCQIIEGKSSDFVLDGLSRFYNEVCVPKICYPDQDGALMKALREGEIDLQDLQGRLHREKGIYFETCLPQGHSAHGRIEAKIKTLQETLERSGMRGSRCTATGWQTIAKAIERSVNGVPLGYLHHQGTANPLLRVLCPSLLKNSTFTDRAPKGLFTIPDSVGGMMTKIENIYNLWFQVWNTEYVPLIMNRQKWHVETENLVENDLVYFKMTDSPLKADWRLGKIEYTKTGRDGLVREVGISYGHKDEEDDWNHYTVERPVRAMSKLMNVEDTRILDDMEEVYKMCRQILVEKNQPKVESGREQSKDMSPAPSSPLSPKPADTNNEEFVPTNEVLDENEENAIAETPEPDVNLKKNTKNKTVKKTNRKPRKSEVEKLKIENKEYEIPVEKTRRGVVRKDDSDVHLELTKVCRQKPLKSDWTNLKLLNMISRQSEEKFEVKANTLSVIKDGTKMTTTWPTVITNEDQIGEVTRALCSGVTELVMGSTQGKDGVDTEQEKLMNEREPIFDNDEFSVFLM